MTAAAWRRLVLAAAVVPLAAIAAPLPGWSGDSAAGRIGFTAHWQHTPVKGAFGHFQVTARLDPAHPQGGRLTVRIDTNSVSTASPDITRAIRGSDWFDAARYPHAVFTATRLSASGTGRMRVQGTLRLKGVSRTISFPMQTAVDAGKLRLSGEFTLNRLDFGIGAGRWAQGSVIATAVAVDFAVTLERVDE